jgi:hypothetical protein
MNNQLHASEAEGMVEDASYIAFRKGVINPCFLKFRQWHQRRVE